MASLSSLSLHAIAQLPSRQQLSSVHAAVAQGSSTAQVFSLRSPQRNAARAPAPRLRSAAAALPAITCMAAAAIEIPTVADTKRAFLDAYRRPIPSIYSNVIQELLVQQHLMRYNTTYKYDAVFALGFVTVYDQLMDGYPSTEDRDAIFKAYIGALKEDPEKYRSDAIKLEAWAKEQNSASIVSFGDGEVGAILKDISERAGSKDKFHYSRFFAIGLFRLLEVAKASDPAILEQLSKALNVNKLSIDRDLDVYRNLLSKLAQAKELLKEYIDREKKKAIERESAAAKKTEEVAKTEAKSE
ncbi:hypothetical protein MARPO_0010s0156 [Marchantia polymorpha]|uniref:Uncharacterized protein n=2 Tax=Marchantia polymorpha TaxID=3197 RepID=A0A176WIU7_MARPO|nr:hypothetical protein AXG93_2912s1050 [Marchantia polymorpha subsp. ruderalis]PTQ46775.1 hypothetical protein MARPO_0010s0156 [Marchantia polymorpha]|eukprot:PTQ46775.1 hypothetical protein MARPO_0010s0156 [Marchantia polymorpha]